MKKIFFIAGFSLFLFLILCASCSKQKESLHIYNWADYIDPELIKQFETENNCVVKMDFFDSNEALYAKVKAGASGYDIYVSSSYMNKVMFDQKMLIPLDHSKLPNIKNIDSEFLKSSIDSKMEFSVPYMVTFTGLAYNKSKIKDFVPSWRMFEREDLKGRMTLF
nr:extracellular solute-binding protein [bacterium]